MADIQLTGNGPVTLKFKFNSPQTFFYVVEVMDDAGKQSFHDQGKWDGTTQFTLGNAADLKGLYLMIAWIVIDPAGAGNHFNAQAIAYENGTAVANPQVCAGVSNAGASKIATVGKFI